MREGKTYPHVVALKKLIDAGEVKLALIICPPKVIPAWKEALEIFKVPEGHVVILSKAKVARLKKYISPDALIVDEIHHCRSYSKVTKWLLKASKTARYRWGLTGTLFDANLLECFYPCQIIDRDLFGSSRGDFLMKYGVADNPHVQYSSWSIRSEDDKARLMSVLDNVLSLRQVDSESLQAPELKVVRVPLLDYQEKLIKEISSKTMDKVGGIEGLDFDHETLPMTRRGKALQVVTGALKLTNGDLYYIPSLRTSYLVDFIKTHSITSAIVWVKYIHEYDLVSKALKSQGYTALTGKDKNAIARYQEGEVDFIALHPKSAGAGVDLSRSDWSLYHSIEYSLIDYLQSQFRIVNRNSLGKKHMVLFLSDSAEDDALLTRIEKKHKEFKDFHHESN